jgi:3-oxoacyl-[acyl-carrier protein] reductase
VAVTDLDGAGAERVASGLRADGLSASSAAVDAGDRVAVEALVAQLGSIEVLVNLAGVMRRAPLTEIDDGDLRLVLATHLEGTLNTMRAVAPGMCEAGYGRIVNISSIAFRGSAGAGAYSAAKGAIEGLTHTVALELASHGVTVNCVAPGLIDAGMFLTTPDQVREDFLGRVPMRRLAQPAEIAACIAFLASRGASYVTGQTLTVCGGLSVGF